ncbi:MGMT family protein [Leptospira levettii]|nr:MGMT family protein [Leptospira levettii]
MHLRPFPLHRVIQSSGLFGGYRWDPKRKQSLLLWEKATHSLKMDSEFSF